MWKWIRNIILFFFLSTILAVVIYRFVPVYYTPLMVIRQFEQLREGKPTTIHHRWVPIEQIGQPLVQAVVASEDNLFMEHDGFDWKQIKKARQDARNGKRLRGASTISQQTAKNVFLVPARSYIRKGLEVYFTFLIEKIWGKERIMEVYLNSIEMGKGIFGAEAAANIYWKKHAFALNVSQSALIAASLPNPRKMNPGKPSAYMRTREKQITSLMYKIFAVNIGYMGSNKAAAKTKRRK